MKDRQTSDGLMLTGAKNPVNLVDQGFQAFFSDVRNSIK